MIMHDNQTELQTLIVVMNQAAKNGNDAAFFEAYFSYYDLCGVYYNFNQDVKERNHGI